MEQNPEHIFPAPWHFAISGFHCILAESLMTSCLSFHAWVKLPLSPHFSSSVKEGPLSTSLIQRLKARYEPRWQTCFHFWRIKKSVHITRWLNNCLKMKKWCVSWFFCRYFLSNVQVTLYSWVACICRTSSNVHYFVVAFMVIIQPLHFSRLKPGKITEKCFAKK